jgi:uncharacterized protein involved in outer membrane biogenesis
MSRKWVWIGGSAAVFVVAAYIGVGTFLGSAVRVAINTLGPRLTKTRVVLDGASISPITGSGTLTGLSVGNPPGWSGNDAFRFERIHVKVAPFSIFSDHILVKDLEIDAPVFNYETKIVSSNMGDLLKTIEDVSGRHDDSAVGPVAANGKPMRIEIRHLLLQGGRIRLGTGDAAIIIPMPPVELHDLGTREGGAAPAGLARDVMRSVTESVVGATAKAAGKLGSTLGAAAGDAAKKAGEDFKSLFP